MTDLPWQRINSRGGAAKAARVQRFAQATGLRPSRAHARIFGAYCEGFGTYSDADPEKCPQGADHTLVWRDGYGGRYIVTTEPYTTARISALEDWCTAHGWDWLAFPDLGMWNPPHTILYLLSPPKSGAPLARFRRRRHPYDQPTRITT